MSTHQYTGANRQPSVTATHWLQTDVCPDECLCHNPSEARVRKLLQPHLEDSESSFYHGVYILECRHRDEAHARSVAMQELDIQRPPYWVSKGANADRLLYVGVSKQVLIRITSHALATSAGANFCTVFPPVRVLDVKWYPTLFESYRKEVKTAERLREEFPSAFVSQPG